MGLWQYYSQTENLTGNNMQHNWQYKEHHKYHQYTHQLCISVGILELCAEISQYNNKSCLASISDGKGQCDSQLCDTLEQAKAWCEQKILEITNQILIDSIRVIKEIGNGNEIRMDTTS